MGIPVVRVAVANVDLDKKEASRVASEVGREDELIVDECVVSLSKCACTLDSDMMFFVLLSLGSVVVLVDFPGAPSFWVFSSLFFDDSVVESVDMAPVSL